MESQERVELPAAFEDVDVDILVRLIGLYQPRTSALSYSSAHAPHIFFLG